MVTFQIYKTYIKSQKPAIIKPTGLGFMIKPRFYANFDKNICVPTLPKIFRPITRNILIFNWPGELLAIPGIKLKLSDEDKLNVSNFRFPSL